MSNSIDWRNRSISSGLPISSDEQRQLEAIFCVRWESLEMMIGGKLDGIANPLSAETSERCLRLIREAAGMRQGNLFSEVR